MKRKRLTQDVSARFVDHLCDRRGDGGLFKPTFQLRQVFLGQDSLAIGVRDGKAAGAQHREHVMRSSLGARLGLPLFPALDGR